MERRDAQDTQRESLVDVINNDISIKRNSRQ